MKKYRKAILKISVSALLLGFLFWKVDKQEIVENIKLLNFAYAPLIFGFIVLNYVIGAFRWKKFLVFENCEKITVKYLVNLYFVGAFFNNFMPTSVGGDAVKFMKLGEKIKNRTNAFTATFMERFTGVVALVIVSYFGLVKTMPFWISQLPENLVSNDLFVSVFKMLLFSGFWIGMFGAFFSMKIVSKKIKFVRKIYESFLQYKGKKDVLVYALVSSFIIQFLAIFTQYFAFSAIGVRIPLDFALFVLPVITLAGFFIPSLNGLGVQDALYIQFFGMVGVPREIALSVSIIYHLFRLAVSLIGGIVYAAGKAD